MTHIPVTIALCLWAISQTHRHVSLGCLVKFGKNGTFYKLLPDKDSVAFSESDIFP
ncbi:hypothetical protein Pla110_35160 [Polystyrenella longa]|uniref:Uncharacterized protein n=1 Tax=Polystyrenella longa TaxID=2528007 RepID=A0A518CRA8_9PLAN|nr:hypothetical protein Pla110_35160 [Polystyrenella longa]